MEFCDLVSLVVRINESMYGKLTRQYPTTLGFQLPRAASAAGFVAPGTHSPSSPAPLAGGRRTESSQKLSILITSSTRWCWGRRKFLGHRTASQRWSPGKALRHFRKEGCDSHFQQTWRRERLASPTTPPARDTTQGEVALPFSVQHSV